MTSSAFGSASALDEVIGDPKVVEGLRRLAPTTHAAAAHFWRTPMSGDHLSPRLKELILLAMHASAAALNATAIERHVRRARQAGATPAREIADVLVTITALANHALYSSVPILEEELTTAGLTVPGSAAQPGELEAAKEFFVSARGFWNSDRERILKAMPVYYDALTAVGTETWLHGPLSLKEREFICIAIDCTVSHTFEPGLRAHIRNALKHGATGEEIQEIFQLAALLGLEGYILGAAALVATDDPPAHTATDRGPE